MAAKQFTALQLKSPYLWFVDIVADTQNYSGGKYAIMRFMTAGNDRYEVQRPNSLEGTVRVLNELGLFSPPYSKKFTAAETAEFINMVVANHPKLHAKTTYSDYYPHLKWMSEHKEKAPAAKKPAVKRAPAKVVAGKVQFKIGRTYFQRWYSDWNDSHSDVFMKVVGRTPTMIEAESNTFGNTPSKIVRKKFKIHIGSDGVEFIMPAQYAGAKYWKASDIVGRK